VCVALYLGVGVDVTNSSQSDSDVSPHYIYIIYLSGSCLANLLVAY
jgi:hypothetical protein